MTDETVPRTAPEILRLGVRLRRLEQQIRVFKELHASELKLILDELESITGELDALRAVEADTRPQEARADDPAASSPKRAKWEAEQRRPVSRRELLRGRGDEG